MSGAMPGRDTETVEVLRPGQLTLSRLRIRDGVGRGRVGGMKNAGRRIGNGGGEKE
jgi:hypothetical protein